MGCGSGKVANDTHANHDNKPKVKGKSEFQKIDDYAKKAPEALKNSAEALVNYMLAKTKDHRLLVRGFFIWITENIKYTLLGILIYIDGFYGRGTPASSDVTSVMKNGLSVCEGYANVMETLCRSAGIEVNKLSGFSKGFGYSPAEKITTSSETDHAWNAVRLDGTWFLLDCTWGAGHSDGQNYIKAFEEFYFFTDPEKFVNDHFPYMENDMSDSMKWQLLENPISLEDFNNNVQLKPRAFALDVTPVSHKRGHIEMNDEIELTFKSQHRLQYSALLSHFDGNWIREMRSATFAKSKSGMGIITVHPPNVGKYSLDIFAKHFKDEGPLGHVAVYSIECNSVKDSTFEFPMVCQSDYTDQCDIIQPRNARLPANSEVVFEIRAPHLKAVSVNREMLKSNGGKFSGKIETMDKGLTYNVNAVFHKGSIIHFATMFQFYTV